MSKISLAPNAAGTAVFTIESPGTSTNRTLTLPDDTGTIVTNSGNQAGSFTTLNTSGAVVFNDAGADVDFRVEGDTNANLIFADASADFVGIGTNGPNNLLTVQADATGAFFGDNGVAQIIARGATDSTKRLGLGIDTTNNVGVIQATQVGVDTYPLALNPAGGNVGIGTSSPFTNTSRATLTVDSSAAGGGEIDLGVQGTKAVRLLTDGSYGLTISADPDNSAASSAIYFNVDGTEHARITSSGRFLLGTETVINAGFLNVSCNANGATPITVASNTSAPNAYMIRFVNNSGTDVGAVVMNATNNGVAYSNFSDYRLKENVAPMTGALAKVLELNPVTFTWKDGGTAGQGFIAHELQAVCPDAVTGEKDGTEIRQVEVSPAVKATYDEEGNELTPAVEAVYEEREVPKYQGVDTSFLVATLTAAIQELKAELDAAKERIAALEANNGV